MKSWVRVLDGRLCVTFAPEYEGESVERRTRALTWRERLLWRLFARRPTTR